jgi:hypothetical protein
MVEMTKEEVSELLALIAGAKEVNEEGMRAVLKLIAEIETTIEWRLVRQWIFRSLPDILPGVPPEEDDRPQRRGRANLGRFRQTTKTSSRADPRRAYSPSVELYAGTVYLCIVAPNAISPSPGPPTPQWLSPS